MEIQININDTFEARCNNLEGTVEKRCDDVQNDLKIHSKNLKKLQNDVNASNQELHQLMLPNGKGDTASFLKNHLVRLTDDLNLIDENQKLEDQKEDENELAAIIRWASQQYQKNQISKEQQDLMNLRKLEEYQRQDAKREKESHEKKIRELEQTRDRIETQVRAARRKERLGRGLVIEGPRWWQLLLRVMVVVDYSRAAGGLKAAAMAPSAQAP